MMQKVRFGTCLELPFVIGVSRLYFCYSQIRAARKFHERQSNAPYKDAVGTNGRRGRGPVSAGGGDNIILINAITTNSYCAYQSPVLVQRHAAGKNLYAVREAGN